MLHAVQHFEPTDTHSESASSAPTPAPTDSGESTPRMLPAQYHGPSALLSSPRPSRVLRAPPPSLVEREGRQSPIATLYVAAASRSRTRQRAWCWLLHASVRHFAGRAPNQSRSRLRAWCWLKWPRTAAGDLDELLLVEGLAFLAVSWVLAFVFAFSRVHLFPGAG
ncbi:hypothetical protein SORBI_3005G098250 [Sorghum bicolor]|uniref:Uncharacterized protein n=1 Tax=Sorghum bicolor TaxID=4558 RepID=A0A1Z5RIA1_SORBI|nr:hypothetical protein SORBI_3005G098250 [Sorghum bicolor]